MTPMPSTTHAAASAAPPPLDMLHVLYFYAPYRSGLTLYAERLCRELAARGHRVTVIAARHDPALAPDERLDGVRVIRLPVAGSFSRAVILPALVPAVMRHLRGTRILHLHVPLAEAAVLAGIGRGMGKRVIVTHMADLDLTGSRLERIASSVALGSGVIGGRLADRVVTNTHDRARVSPFVRKLGDNVSVVAPPIEIAMPRPGAGDEMRRRYGMGSGPVIGFVGRMVFEKGIEVLAKAIPIVRDRMPDAMFAFAGPTTGPNGAPLTGPWDAELARHPAAVRRLGPLSPQELADFYAFCDVLVLPSTNWTETFGMVQVEAMLCGTPVIATDLPGVREPVGRTGMGRVLPAGDVDALAAAILEVVANRERYVQPAEEIRRRYSLTATVDAYEALYRGEIVEPFRR